MSTSFDSLTANKLDIVIAGDFLEHGESNVVWIFG